MQSAVSFDSYRPIAPVATATHAASHFHGVEGRFIENWAQLAQSIGMDDALGRVHAALYLSGTPLSAGEVADHLSADLDLCVEHLQTLVAFGAAHSEAREDGICVFVADCDPWSWFMKTVRARARREFTPLLASIRAVNVLAQEARAAHACRLDPERSARIERIGRFTSFVDQVSGMIETFASLGSAPLLATMRMASKLMR
jgi:DNA-binding transcriptional regulator GbsR (MarR family)